MKSYTFLVSGIIFLQLFLVRAPEGVEFGFSDSGISESGTDSPEPGRDTPSDDPGFEGDGFVHVNPVVPKPVDTQTIVVVHPVDGSSDQPGTFSSPDNVLASKPQTVNVTTGIRDNISSSLAAAPAVPEGLAEQDSSSPVPKADWLKAYVGDAQKLVRSLKTTTENTKILEAFHLLEMMKTVESKNPETLQDANLASEFAQARLSLENVITAKRMALAKKMLDLYDQQVLSKGLETKISQKFKSSVRDLLIEVPREFDSSSNPELQEFLTFQDQVRKLLDDEKLSPEAAKNQFVSLVSGEFADAGASPEAKAVVAKAQKARKDFLNGDETLEEYERVLTENKSDPKVARMLKELRAVQRTQFVMPDTPEVRAFLENPVEGLEKQVKQVEEKAQILLGKADAISKEIFTRRQTKRSKLEGLSDQLAADYKEVRATGQGVLSEMTRGGSENVEFDRGTSGKPLSPEAIKLKLITLLDPRGRDYEPTVVTQEATRAALEKLLATLDNPHEPFTAVLQLSREELSLLSFARQQQWKGAVGGSPLKTDYSTVRDLSTNVETDCLWAMALRRLEGRPLTIDLSALMDEVLTMLDGFEKNTKEMQAIKDSVWVAPAQ